MKGDIDELYVDIMNRKKVKLTTQYITGYANCSRKSIDVASRQTL
jgi:hypothetical protein